MPSLYTCELNVITTQGSCDNGGIKKCYYAKNTDIDWSTMADAPLSWDADTYTISTFTMLGGAVFKTLTNAKRGGKYDFVYTQDAAVYDIMINLIFEGKSSVTSLNFTKLITCCNLCLVIMTNNGLGRVVGKEWDGDAFDDLVDNLRLDRHGDFGGELGGDKARDEMDIKGGGLYAPVHHDIDVTTFESNYI